MTDLLTRLLALAELAVSEALEFEYGDPEDRHIWRELQELKPLVVAALAQPEQEVLARVEFGGTEFNCPSDVVLSQYCDDWFFGNPRDEVDPVDLCRGAIKLFAQMPTPIPVEERQPGPEDCDAEDECYWFDPAGTGAWYLDTYQGNYTHWLPHHALPVPATRKDD
jgi:hypothetical protein